jgi:hypothetical protein
MATDAQGRQLSDDGNYYWDGANWQLVDQSAASGGVDQSAASGGVDQSAASGGDGSTSSQQSQSTDAQGRQLSPDGNYYWDGSNWQPVQQGADAPDAGDAAHQGSDAIDWSKFPMIEGLTKVSSVDEWTQHIGLDPNDLNVS